MVLRVVAYCRVSTDSQDQANSLESQKRYFSEYINRNPDWKLVKVYVDEGITGTSTKKRKDFNQMIADAEQHFFDLIITKEISRFARNTLDSIYYTRKLKDLHIGVLFMNDNINTLDPDSELRLTIMSSIAQEESRKTSERVKWGQKRQMEKGVVFGRNMLGYDVRGGELLINKEGADIVRLIFHKFVNEDKGTHVIARELRDADIPTSTHMKTWSYTVILRVLRNEKYCGDLVQKKTFTPSYLTHEKKYNRGQEEMVILRDHHEPIISREMFDLAQLILEQRSPSPERKAKHSNRYCFSGKINCAICKSTFVSRTKKRNNGSDYKAWRCYERARNGSPHVDQTGNQIGCSCPSINDDDAKEVLQHIVRNLHNDVKKAVDKLSIAITEVVNTTDGAVRILDLKNELDLLNNKKKRLSELYVNGDFTKLEYVRMKSMIEEHINSIQLALVNASDIIETKKIQSAEISEITETVSSIAAGEEWDDLFYRQLLKSMTVGADGNIDIRLNLHPLRWKVALFENGCNIGTSVSAPKNKKNNGLTSGFRSDWCKIGSSVPISVRVPFTSPQGAV